MRFLVLSVMLTGSLMPSTSIAGPNVPLCLAMEKNYNECLTREGRRERHWRHEREEWGASWDDGPPPGENCAAWLVQLKANGCF
jgi:hypothetical protein